MNGLTILLALVAVGALAAWRLDHVALVRAERRVRRLTLSRDIARRERDAARQECDRAQDHTEACQQLLTSVYRHPAVRDAVTRLEAVR